MKMVSAFTTLVCEECDKTVKVRHEGSEKKIWDHERVTTVSV